MSAGIGGQVLLLGAGALAGVVGTSGGITSLISYPALLVTGVGPLAANVANLVALVACWPSSAVASRRELRGSGKVLSATIPVAAAAAAAGSLLLLATPPRAFDRVVPWLVLAGSAALVAQPALAARRGEGRTSPRVLLGWVAVLSVYGGYFGAGSGVMLLVTLLLLYDPQLPRANAVKNMLIGAAAVASAALLAATRPVVWSAVTPLAAGLFLGSLLGPVAARRLPPVVVRYVAAALGVVLAVDLWVHPG